MGNQPPIAAVVFALIGLVLFFGLPLAGLLWRAPWGEFMSVLREDSAQQALRLSLICSLSATGLSVLFGIPIAWLLARGRFAGLSVVRALALLPLVLPPVVGGVALFYAFGRRGLIGQWLDRGFGIQLPLNFNSPYRALNVVDFWRRWHMTLSQFLRDYLYIPLGGNRHGRTLRYVNLMITMLLGGLWHGAAWTFVAWGALHGIYLCINHAWNNYGPAVAPHFDIAPVRLISPD